MDPVQRIPRYTLLFRTMIKLMGPNEPQRAKLIEADEIASKIALAETDDQTKRATIMYCLGAAIEDFPPALISNSRRFIDCIDVEDVLSESYSAPGSSTSSNGPPPNLHCSLVLFDDKLMIVKRPGNGEKGCRVLAGLVDTGKPTKSGKALSLKKSGMVCKGVVDVTDVVITDVGGPGKRLHDKMSQSSNLTSVYCRFPSVFRSPTNGADRTMGRSSIPFIVGRGPTFSHQPRSKQNRIREEAIS